MSQKKMTKNISSRPPIVVVLGHVDHGKTTLLDTIRKTSLAPKEAGGITQHIGAYQVHLTTKDQKPATITFIDTPGHIAFGKMRARGAQVADLAVLVVSAEEGVKPQTEESLKIIRLANIPFLVALNKIDLPNIILEKAKKSLVDHGIPIEGYGGQVVVVPVSAKTGKGLDDLLEMILLLGEMAGIKGDPQGKLEAVIIESRLDRRRGPVATILVRNGTMTIGQYILAEGKEGKVKAMTDEWGKKVDKALPSQPIEILGFPTVPPIGARVTAGVTDQGRGKKDLSPPPVAVAIPPETEIAKKTFKVILKADTLGTLEAVKASLPSSCQVLDEGVGDVNESDVMLAKTTKSEIIGFAVKASGSVKKLAEVEKVKISTYSVIYELIEAMEQKVGKFLKPEGEEEILGRAEIVAEFKIRGERIAGCRVKEGTIFRSNLIRLIRGETIIGLAKIKSMRTGKVDVERCEVGGEFGAILSPSLDFIIGDMVVSLGKT